MSADEGQGLQDERRGGRARRDERGRRGAMSAADERGRDNEIQ